MSDTAQQARDAANSHEAGGNTDTADLLDEMSDTIEALRAENERLRAIVDRLPKTADGVPVGPGSVVWGCSPHFLPPTGEHVREGAVVDKSDWAVCLDGGAIVALDRCYSTREAANAAREARDE